MINSLNPLLFSIKLASSYRWVSIFFLVLLSTFSVIMFGGLNYIHVHGSVDCDRQTFSPVDCPPSSSSSGEEETDNDDEGDGGNIEEEIPSVIPFP